MKKAYIKETTIYKKCSSLTLIEKGTPGSHLKCQ